MSTGLLFLEHAPLDALRRHLGVRKLPLFGSGLMGNARPDSAIDVLVKDSPAELQPRAMRDRSICAAVVKKAGITADPL